MHALAALTDYPTRDEVHDQWKALADRFQELGQAWTDLANNLRNGTEPEQLSDLLMLLENRGIDALPGEQNVSARFDDADQSAGQALYYHSRNAINLTSRIREAIVRMLRGERK